MPPKSKRVLPGKRYPLNMRTTKELRDKIEQAATDSGRSLVQEVEFRLERSFQQQEIEKEIERKLQAQAHEVRDEIFKEMQRWRDEMRREMGITEEAQTQQANKPKLSDLARFADSPEDTSKQTATEKKGDPK
jgi:hypothetical protein